MVVTVWGVRGSFPQTSVKYQIYGGNTSCVSAEMQDVFVVFDGGTGLFQFGQYWKESGSQKPIHLFFSHSHMDHLMGLYNFAPFFNPEAEIHIYGEDKNGMSFKEQIGNIMQNCYWPVQPDTMPAQIHFHDVTAGEEICLGSYTITTGRSFHPGGALMYKLQDGDKTMVYALDCELTNDAIKQLAPFMEGADALFADTHFSDEDLEAHRGWGHSTANWQMKLAEAAGIKHVYFMHYSCNYNDRRMTELENAFRATHRAGTFTREGMEIVL